MIPFDPKHKVSFEQLSKDLQDRFKKFFKLINELEEKVNKTKKDVHDIIDGKFNESAKKLKDIQNKIAQYTRDINAILDKKIQDLQNRKYTGATTENLFGKGQDGQWAKIDPNMRNLFGDNGFDVLLVYNDISSQELTQLNGLDPYTIKEQYGVVVGHSQLAFDLDKKKIYMHVNGAYREVPIELSGEYFEKYLMNRSFYLNPLTKKLYFYYFFGKWCLIYSSNTDSDIGKIIGDTDTVVWERLQPERKTVPVPPPPPPPEPIPSTDGGEAPVKESPSLININWAMDFKKVEYDSWGEHGGNSSVETFYYTAPVWNVIKLGIINTVYGKVLHEVVQKDENIPERPAYHGWLHRHTRYIQSRQEEYERKSKPYIPIYTRVGNYADANSGKLDGSYLQGFTNLFRRIDNQGIVLPNAIYFSLGSMVADQIKFTFAYSKPTGEKLRIEPKLFPLDVVGPMQPRDKDSTGVYRTGRTSAIGRFSRFEGTSFVFKIKFAVCAYNANINNDNYDGRYPNSANWEYKVFTIYNQKDHAETFLEYDGKENYTKDQLLFYNDPSKNYDTLMIKLITHELIPTDIEGKGNKKYMFPAYRSTVGVNIWFGKESIYNNHTYYMLLSNSITSSLKIWTGISNN
nr:MAG TPA: hypothetical protein [Caudoviricetes sp.]